MFRNCPPLVGCHGHSDTDIPAYLLFTTYHRRIIILSGYCHRCIAHVQLGICTDTNPVLHPRICTPPAPLGIEWNPLFRKAYDRFRSTLRFVIRHRYATVGLMVVLLVVSTWSFKFIPKVFVPALEKPYFTLDVWLPEGTDIAETDRTASEMADYIRSQEETEMISTYVGRTPPRYYLSNVSFGPQPNYAQLLVKARSSKETKALRTRLQDSIRTLFPGPLIKVNKFELSPLTEAVIEARFLGPRSCRTRFTGRYGYRDYAPQPESSGCPQRMG